MDAVVALDLVNGMFVTALVLAGPVLGAALATGVIVGVMQVATQLQEVTLSYVPKIAVCGLVLVLIGPWLLDRLNQFATSMFLMVPHLG